MDRKPTVLIADDEDLFRISVVEALKSTCPGYEVLAAGNGAEALSWVDRQPVDVVVSDVNMPEKDGLQLMLELRDRGFPGSVIIVTAFGDPRLETEVIHYGAFSYLEKPVQLSRLVGVIRNAVESERSHIVGLTLAGFVQLLALEQKTCRLQVSSNGRHGDLLFRAGILVDARLGPKRGDGAALELLAWDEGARLALHPGVEPKLRTITSPLNQLLMEAMQLKDEAKVASPAPATPQASDDPPSLAGPDGIDSCLREALDIRGAIGVALVSLETGENLGQVGGGALLDLSIAGPANVDVVRAKMIVMKDLGIEDSIEDILVTLGEQYHLIRPLSEHSHLFLYVALERHRANLAMARRRLMDLERSLVL